MSFGIVDEPGALTAEIVVDLMQRVRQLAGCHASGEDAWVGQNARRDMAEMD
jgi:hypothetical protein